MQPRRHSFLTRIQCQLLISGVAVEKLEFLENQREYWDRKRLSDPSKSFVGHPDAIQFLPILQIEFFNSHSPKHSSRTGDCSQCGAAREILVTDLTGKASAAPLAKRIQCFNAIDCVMIFISILNCDPENTPCQLTLAQRNQYTTRYAAPLNFTGSFSAE